MKRKMLCIAAAMLCFPQAAYAAESASTRYKYSFETGADIEYAKHTPTDQMGRNTLTENIRRDKDIQVMPPAYFFGDGVFTTVTSNPYVTVQPQNFYQVTTPTDSIPAYDTLGTGVNYGANYGTSIGNGVYVSTEVGSSLETEVKEYADGSMGTLKINSINLKVKVYDGESNASMQKGLGHFSYTSAWDGNVGLCGHNGGSGGYFENLKDVEKGDKITYTTKYGTRTYKVTSMKTIYDDDFSDLLEDTNDNRLTLITCVRNQSDKRLCVIAKES